MAEQEREDAAALAARGREVLHAGDAQGARAMLERALALAPKDAYLALDLARACVEVGDAARARALLEPLCRSRQAPARAHEMLGRVREAAGEPALAADAFRRALALDPGHTRAAGELAALYRAHRARVPTELAALLFEQRAFATAEPEDRRADEVYDEAAAVFRRALEADAADGNARAGLALALAGRGRVEEALAELDAAPHQALLRAVRGDLLVRVGRREDAVAAYLDALALADDAGVRVSLGRALARLGREADALAEFRRAAQGAPGLSAAHLGVAVLARRAGLRDEAARALERFRQLAPQDPRGIVVDPDEYTARGLACAASDPEAARAELERACALAPDDAGAWVNLGAVLLALDRPEEALAACRRALELEPGHAAALFNAALACDACGDGAGAEEAYRRALAAGDGDAALNLAALLEHTGRSAEARQVLGDAARRDPAAWEAHAAAARLARLAGDAEGALAATAEAVARHPDRAEVVLARALALAATGRDGEARALADAFAAAHPDEAPAEFLRGRVLAQLGLFEDAVPALARAILIDPGLDEAYGPLAMALAGTGRLDEARAAAAELLRRAPASAASHLTAAFVSQRAGDVAGRERALAAAWSLDPQDGAVSLALARMRLEDGRPAGALEVLERWLGAHDATPAMFSTAADAEFRLGRFERAAELYEDAYRRGGRAMPCVVNQAIARARAGDVARALALLALPALARCAEAHAVAGRLLADSDPLAAEERLARAIELAPDRRAERMLAGALALERGAAGEALAVLEHPSVDADPRGLYQHGLAADRAGQLERAHALFLAAAERGIADAALNLALVCRQQRDFAGEMNALAAAREAGADAAALALLAAQAHALRGRPRRALETLADADSNDPVALALAGSLLVLTGKSAAALPVLDAALAALPKDPDLEHNRAVAALFAGDAEGGWERAARATPGPRAGDWLLRACLAERAGSLERARAVIELGLSTPVADGGLAADPIPDHLDRERFVLMVARGNLLAVTAPADALEAYLRALALLPGPPPRYLLTNLGRLLAGRPGNPWESVRALARVTGDDRRALAIAARAAAGAGAPLIDNTALLWLLRSEIGVRFASRWLLP